MLRHFPSVRRATVAGLLVIGVTCAFPRAAHASDIEFPGWDVFDPFAGTLIDLPGLGLTPFIGVPLGTFDFGFGPVSTGNGDTIIRRAVPAPPNSTIPIEIIAMQLVSVAPIDLGSGLDLHYLTLSAVPSTGEMSFDAGAGPHVPPPAHGFVTYDFINWFYDVRKGALGGPVVSSDSKVLSTGPVPWSHFPAPGGLAIPCVNVFVDGTPPLCADGTFEHDFFPEPFAFTAADGTLIPTRAAVPEPVPLALVGAGLLMVLARQRRRRRSTTA
jgi:hypothetical protein